MNLPTTWKQEIFSLVFFSVLFYYHKPFTFLVSVAIKQHKLFWKFDYAKQNRMNQFKKTHQREASSLMSGTLEVKQKCLNLFLLTCVNAPLYLNNYCTTQFLWSQMRNVMDLNILTNKNSQKPKKFITHEKKLTERHMLTLCVIIISFLKMKDPHIYREDDLKQLLGLC